MHAIVGVRDALDAAVLIDRRMMLIAASWPSNSLAALTFLAVVFMEYALNMVSKPL